MNKELNDICEECKNEDISVSQNLIKYGYKKGWGYYQWQLRNKKG